MEAALALPCLLTLTASQFPPGSCPVSLSTTGPSSRVLQAGPAQEPVGWPRSFQGSPSKPLHGPSRPWVGCPWGRASCSRHRPEPLSRTCGKG